MRINNLPELSYLHECFSYDPESGGIIWKERPINHFFDVNTAQCWNSRRAGSVAGTLHTRGYLFIGLLGKQYAAHRIAWVMYYGYEPENLIDHINNAPSDNRISNLREATHAENHRNKPGHSDRVYKDLPKGVLIRGDNRRNKYYAQICVSGIKKNLGSFPTIELAKAAYDKAALEFHGEFARV